MKKWLILLLALQSGEAVAATPWVDVLLSGGAVRPTYTVDFTKITDSTLPSWIDGSATAGNRTQFDSTGNLVWAPANLLLNSATLATQTVSTGIAAGADFILSFSGTGSVAISGGYVGNLSGTGVNNRVYAKFSSTTSSLTFTVTGSVTSAQLEPVTYQTSPAAYIATTAAQSYRPRLDYDAVTKLPLGMQIEETRQNVLLHSIDFASVPVAAEQVWTYTNVTNVSSARLSPDGRNNAVEVQASAGNGTLIASAALGTSAQRYLSVWLKCVTCTGAVQFTMDNGATWTTQAATSNWIRYSLAQTTAAQQVGFRIVNSGDTVQIYGAQLEPGSFATSFIPTVAAAVTRAADNVKLSGTPLAQAIAATGSIGIETSNANIQALPIYFMASSATRRIFYSGANTVVSNYNGSAAVSATLGNGTNWQTGIMRTLVSWDALGRSIVANLGAYATVTTLMAGGTNVYFGSTSGPAGGVMWFRSMAIYNSRLSNNQMRQKSLPGGQY